MGGWGVARGLQSTDTPPQHPSPALDPGQEIKESKKSVHKMPCLWVEPGSGLAASQPGDSTGHAWLDTTLAPQALPTAEGSPVSPSLVALLSSISCVLQSSFTPKELPVFGV